MDKLETNTGVDTGTDVVIEGVPNTDFKQSNEALALRQATQVSLTQQKAKPPVKGKAPVQTNPKTSTKKDDNKQGEGQPVSNNAPTKPIEKKPDPAIVARDAAKEAYDKLDTSRTIPPKLLQNLNALDSLEKGFGVKIYTQGQVEQNNKTPEQIKKEGEKNKGGGFLGGLKQQATRLPGVKEGIAIKEGLEKLDDKNFVGLSSSVQSGLLKEVKLTYTQAKTEHESNFSSIASNANDPKMQTATYNAAKESLEKLIKVEGLVANFKNKFEKQTELIDAVAEFRKANNYQTSPNIKYELSAEQSNQISKLINPDEREIKALNKKIADKNKTHEGVLAENRLDAVKQYNETLLEIENLPDGNEKASKLQLAGLRLLARVGTGEK